jgi:hypothetical protein
LELAGMGAPKADELGEDLEGLGLEMMFDGFDFLLYGVGAQAEEIQHFGEGLVPDFDVLGHSAALLGEGETAVFFVIDEAAFGEAADHVGDGGAAEAKRGGEVSDAGVALLLDEFLDPLQMVLGGFGAVEGVGLGFSGRACHCGLYNRKGGRWREDFDHGCTRTDTDSLPKATKKTKRYKEGEAKFLT